MLCFDNIVETSFIVLHGEVGEPHHVYLGLSMKLRRAVSEAVAVIVLSLVLTIGIFVAFAMGLYGISKVSKTHSEDIEVQLVDIAFQPSSCSINITLNFVKPITVQSIILVLNNNTVVHDFGFGATLYGYYAENANAYHRPIAIVVTTLDGRNIVLKP